MYICSWSGGKDSCLAYFEASQQGYQIGRLINFISREYRRVSFHGTEDALIQQQAACLNIPLFQKETTPNGYEKEFKQAVGSLSEVKGMVFGDIHLDEHREWVERVCSELGIEAVEPLWGRTSEEVFSSFLKAGFEAVVISLNGKKLDRRWVGHQVDNHLLSYLRSANIEVCGENGEYHTLVVDGPVFEKRIEIKKTQPIKKGDYWFLDIKEYSIVPKVINK